MNLRNGNNCYYLFGLYPYPYPYLYLCHLSCYYWMTYLILMMNRIHEKRKWKTLTHQNYQTMCENCHFLYNLELQHNETTLGIMIIVLAFS